MSERSPFAHLAALGLVALGATGMAEIVGPSDREPDPPRLPKPSKPAAQVHSHSREIARRLRQLARKQAKEDGRS